MMPTRGEFVTLYDGETGKPLFETVAHDCIEELSSPGPKEEEVEYWIHEVDQVASMAELRAFIKRSGATVPPSGEEVQRLALWIAACDYAAETEHDEDYDYGDDEDDDEEE